MRINRLMFITLLCCGMASLAPASLAQHGHAALSPSVTYPQNDAVLTSAPRNLTLSFRVNVRLLKLSLYTESGDYIDIGFVYDSQRTNNNFVLPVPVALPPARYYIASWSVVDGQQRFMNGEISFSFGPDARAPSEIIASEAGSIEEENLPATGSYVRTRPLN